MPADQREKADGGFTLIELMVAMAILGLVLGVIFSILTSVVQGMLRAQTRSENVNQARIAAENIDRFVRSGNVLYDPSQETTPMSLRVYTQANGNEQCMQWKVSSGSLRVRSWSPDWQQNGQVSSWRTVARDIVNSTTPFSLDTTSTSYGSRLLKVDLLVSANSTRGNTVEVQSSVEGRNTEFGYPTSVCATIPSG